ncbi:Gfo/Idh/MocA family protein [Emticicia sp. 21SJ11W-3]|uniref:Gfo/Idh/MocA family protein n=1 Tax=Emticicia sp. 21SJ11W-3 TaxID=2916755 RepID=UPI0020A0AD9C|nr:Gfo/Idh/MocA family oxidoreductase [Emticicia sp. 21SJ11W-3]UTA67671.1 Gfo/Idh/MocA family oxidoreductase [Emticicia sp. 21SJ11W-3]
MENNPNNRRKFLKDSLASTAGIVLSSSLVNEIAAKSATVEAPYIHRNLEPSIRFSVIGLNHGHIYGMTEAIIRGGGQLVSVYAKEPDLLAAYVKRYPDVKQAGSEKEVLEDKSTQLILSAAIASERAPIGIKAMQHGKDFMADKPGITSLEQLALVRKVQKETRRIYSIMFSERFENRATVKAGELIKTGAIGKVVQTIGLGPHRMNTKTRPEWFFDKNKFGGIITDIASHQFDQFLFFTGSTKGEIVSSQTGNLNHPEFPLFEDFGDAMVKGNGGTGYIRVDWFTPDGLKTWGDGRLTILGTEGYIEIRKNIDIAIKDKGNNLYLVNNQKTEYIDCSNAPLPFGSQLVSDIVNRTETAMTQDHCFLATELSLKAQKFAKRLTFAK